MHTLAGWKRASPPNYSTNYNKGYPYSEVPYIGEYNIVRIPTRPNDLIELVDYWGEGRIVTTSGSSGFTNSYNVNHQFQLVSNGTDRGRKIPNRIPVEDYNNCDTSSYIKDNSVSTVTVMGAPINHSCARDIARIVNQNEGKVVVFGFDSNSQDIQNLTSELMNKSLFLCPSYTLTDDLLGLTLFQSHIAFLNLTFLQDELFRNVTNGKFEAAIDLIKILDNENGGEAIFETIKKLISNNSINTVTFAYKLWSSGSKSIVNKYFPVAFKLICNEDNVTIVNMEYHQALKLDASTDEYNDRLAWGDSNDKTSKRVSWKIIPVVDGDNVTFKLYNIDCDMYIKLDATVDSIGDRQAWGSKNNDELRHRYKLKPFITNGKLAYHIINCQYDQVLKLDVNVDSMGDRLLWGHNGYAQEEYNRFKWIIAAW